MRRANLARQRGLPAAERRVRDELGAALDMLEQHIHHERRLLEKRGVGPPLASPLDIYRDLVALFDEFPTVAWCTEQKTISATTERVRLEGVDLGPFTICLRWDSLDCSHNYEVIAEDPHPPASDSSITHPHVQDGHLCEGDGHAGISRSLAEGRLLDFFLIVRGILNTYNSGGPYVALDEWDGVHCGDCGSMVDVDDMQSCLCGAKKSCDECSLSCAGCCCTICDECGHPCSQCQERCCASCEASCADCGARLCPECQTEGRCKSCAEKNETPSIEYEPAVPVETDAAV